MRLRHALALTTLAFVGCASPTPKPQVPVSAPPQASDGAADGVQNAALGAVLADHWSYTMRRNPVWATELGDHRYDSQIADRSKAAHDEDSKKLASLLVATQAVSAEGLSETDRVYQGLFIEHLQGEIAAEACHFEQWSISPRSNPVTEWSYLPELHKLETVADGNNLLARMTAAAKSVDVSIENLSHGAKQKWFTNQESTARVIKMVRALLAKPVAEWAMAKPAKTPGQDWPKADQQRFSKALMHTLSNDMKPALQRYLAFLESEILPNARDEAHSGLGALPFGKACYQARVEHFTTLTKTADEHHDIGLSEIKRINQQMAELGKKLFGASNLAETLVKLRTDKALYFDSAEELESKAAAALAKAKAAMPQWFGILPKAKCVVQRIPDYEAPFTTIAYYRQPAPDGSKPGEYFINVYEPQTRPRYELEALSFHEAIPGHHLQIAIAQERPAMPAFLRHIGMTAFVEGWALYTEQLADEMGLYTADLDRMGMLSYEAWRASRLVVDTGLHAMGWSRERAKAFMLAHTALAANNIDNEVDRYIVWPGQALAYKTGQMEIWKLRREAETELGKAFDIKAFHAVVLEQGAVSLPILRNRVEAWVKSQASS